MNIQEGDKVVFELCPDGRPRWTPHPDKKNEFLDGGYTGIHGTGYVQEMRDHEKGQMISILFDEQYRTNIVGIYMPRMVYEKHIKLPGFYQIQLTAPQCSCGGEGKGYHWLFCPAWKRY